MAAVSTERVWFIIRGMTQYVNRIYKSEKFRVTDSEITMEELYLPRQLKDMLKQSFDRMKYQKYIVAHNHCVDMLNPVKHVKKSFRSGLNELAREQKHNKFIHECVLYILSATEMEQLDFPEAIDIVMDAIYQACMNTDQHASLVLWDTQPAEKRNSVSNHLHNQSNKERHKEKPRNTNQHQDVSSQQADDVYFSPEIDILG